MLSVTVTVGNVPHQRHLPAFLRDQGVGCRVLRFSPRLQVEEPDAVGEFAIVRNFPMYNAAKQAAFRLRPHLRASWFDAPQLALAHAADGCVAPFVSGDVFHGMTSACLKSLRAAQRAGARTLVERTGQHPLLWNRDVLAECTRFGVRPSDVSTFSAAMTRRMQQEYESADAIAVLSTSARDGFRQFPGGHKAVVVHPCADENTFCPAAQAPDLFRACFVGRVELAKGIPYLLEAWNKLNLANAELELVGEVHEHIRPILRRYATSSIRFSGHLRSTALRDAYQRASVFVFPSFNEGLACVLLEAMACGLPVIATSGSGASDCVVDGKTGFIVPPRDSAALADAILWCFRHRDEARAMGEAGRQLFLQHFTLRHYLSRQLALYRDLAAGVTPTESLCDVDTSSSGVRYQRPRAQKAMNGYMRMPWSTT